jgi:hypothetical protein
VLGGRPIGPAALWDGEGRRMRAVRPDRWWIGGRSWGKFGSGSVRPRYYHLPVVSGGREAFRQAPAPAPSRARLRRAVLSPCPCVRTLVLPNGGVLFAPWSDFFWIVDGFDSLS